MICSCERARRIALQMAREILNNRPMSLKFQNSARQHGMAAKVSKTAVVKGENCVTSGISASGRDAPKAEIQPNPLPPPSPV